MTPKSRHSITIAAVVVAVAAVAGIAAIQGWLPERITGSSGGNPPPPIRVTGSAPPETLLPGESVVTLSDKPAVAPPAVPGPAFPVQTVPAPSVPGRAPPADPRATLPPPIQRPPAPEPPPSGKPRPVQPTYAAPYAPPRPTPEASRASCPSCGVITAMALRDNASGEHWEVRVRFEDGSRRIFRYPSDPAFQVGDRVVFSRGRLQTN